MKSSAQRYLSPKVHTPREFGYLIYSLMGWDFNNRYKLLGKLIRSNGELLYIFDLTTPEIFTRKDVDGKPRTSRTPSYPEDWKDHFGISVKEHRANLKVNIYNGYAVFGLQGENNEKQ